MTPAVNDTPICNILKIHTDIEKQIFYLFDIGRSEQALNRQGELIAMNYVNKLNLA